ncbi:uncharacterized protein LOC130298273 [Hyla sarda]|uniref:uncharacterized protein LOC130298273 n=1 Tax=Hyla sarda TaxID=327740 RepID=UPI0024C25FEE|nr:uncharacterized protein LOC130298273 [Hyla sarda]XP_056407190.1 uncharacterized protein LOC130298273 [Hyla sarda]
MSSCIVSGCATSWRRRNPNISLHCFPKDKDRIKLWLEKTGHYANNLQEMVEKVWIGTINDTYRMCSLHFSNESFRYYEDRRTLRKDAIPSIFGQDLHSKESLSKPPSNGQQLPKQGCGNEISNSSVTKPTNVFSVSDSFSQKISDNLPKIQGDLEIERQKTTTNSVNLPGSHDIYILPGSVPSARFQNISNLTYGQQLTTDNQLYNFGCTIIKNVSNNDNVAKPSLETIEHVKKKQLKSVGTQTDQILKRDFATNTTYLHVSHNKATQTRVFQQNKKIMCSILKTPSQTMGIQRRLTPSKKMIVSKKKTLNLQPIHNKLYRNTRGDQCGKVSSLAISVASSVKLPIIPTFANQTQTCQKLKNTTQGNLLDISGMVNPTLKMHQPVSEMNMKHLFRNEQDKIKMRAPTII